MPEVQDVFRLYGDEYRQKQKLSAQQFKAMSAIEQCRTSALGGHMDVCNNCGNTEISYNSCRDRHCPKCQTLSKEKWIDARKHDLLNVGYFHIVFTVPSEIRPLFYQNQGIMYNLLFRTAAETLQELASSDKYLGARTGFTSILHTWGQNLSYHPHLHCIVSGGGLSTAGKWVQSRKKFFIPVKVLSRKFRGKFLYYLRKCQKLQFYGDIKHLVNLADFNKLMDCLYQREWIVYCKPPFKDSACVVEYLGRYTHRVAISNNRILSVEGGKVTFKWRDYKDQSRWKVMVLSAIEFIRRFLMHILPKRFVKIRHYGLLASREKTKTIGLCKRLTGTPILPKVLLSTAEMILALTGRDILKCSACGYEKSLQYSGLAPPTT